MKRTSASLVLQSLLVLGLLDCAFHRPVHAELYLAGQFGVVLPQKLTDVDQGIAPAMPARATLSDLSLENSLMGGGKIGYYFDSLKWLGVEFEAFHTTPHVKQQAVTESAVGTPSFTEVRPGGRLLVSTVALNIVVRAQLGYYEPYVGVGVAGFIHQLNGFGRRGQGPIFISGDRAGLNTQLGLRYRVTDHFSVFEEWKFNRARFEFDSPAMLDGTYSVHHLVFGICYHFW
ncbi:porin family protein [Nitrospiraceae bacterium AH_259_D15_M11_P09]|nr:porin family protein [Nitrospiraceae bacterium AH_259_D15_M11_P09]